MSKTKTKAQLLLEIELLTAENKRLTNELKEASTKSYVLTKQESNNTKAFNCPLYCSNTEEHAIIDCPMNCCGTEDGSCTR